MIATPLPSPTPMPVITVTCPPRDPQRAASEATPAPDPTFAPGQVYTLVRVRIDATGKVLSAAIERSSGNGQLDESALRTAEHSTYSPATIVCGPAVRDYLFVATFTPDS